LKVEPSCQAGHVFSISLPRSVAAVVLNLEFGRQAWNDHVHDPSDGEPFGRAGTIGAIERRAYLPSGPVFVERDGMEINLPARW
jgi:hypothetical protein